MKKLGFIMMPLMAISLLTSCGCSKGGGGGGDPSSTAKITLSGDSRNCKLVYNGTNCLIGNSIFIPAGITTTLTVEPINNYLPVFSSNLTFTGEAYEKTFFSDRKEITVNVAKDKKLTIKATTDKPKKAKLEDYSWPEINEISGGDIAPAVFKVGDKKSVRVNGKNHQVRIIDFNKDKDPEGNTLGITFEFVNVITKSDGEAAATPWNAELLDESKNYDYRESTLNDFLNDETDGVTSVINMLPSGGDEHPDLREVIKPVDKKVGVSTDSGDSYIATSFDGEAHPYPYLFPLAHDEIHNPEETPTVVTPDETDGIYKYYEGHGGDTDEDMAYRVKKAVNSDVVSNYWFRSPYIGYDVAAHGINFEGFIFSFNIYESEGASVAPAFCI